jgi:hypothetical protein
MAQSALVRESGIALFMIVTAALWMGLAAAPAKAAQGQGPCADDMQKFCKDVQPGGGRIARCLKEHESELSPECKEKMEPRKGQYK